jgi:nitrogen fixation protein NifU and related proteins
MLHPRLIDHFQNPRNVGELASPAIVVEARNPVCGDILRLSAKVEDGVVAAAAFKTRGCTASIASGSALTELLIGRSKEAIKSLRAADVEAAVGELSAESKHAAVLCMDAVRKLLADQTVNW